MLAVTEPGVEIITAMVCTQLLKTTLLENVFGYFAHLDPCPMLLVQPKDDAAEAFSKERIGPMIRATPVLRELVGSRKTRNAAETLTYKAYPGGFLALVGAGSPDNLARRPVRVVMYDEVDKYIPTKEGDAITLGDERMASFETRALSIRVCSPTRAGESRIERSYQASDERRASLVCPRCDHRQFPIFWDHVKWEKSEDGRHQPETGRLACERCGAWWEEGERLRALSTIRWHQTRPFTCCDERQEPLQRYRQAWSVDGLAEPVEAVWDWWEGPRHAVYRAKCCGCGEWKVSNTHAGFQGGKVFSPFSKDTPAKQAEKFLDAKSDVDTLRVFVNTQCAETFKETSSKDVDIEVLMARRELWPAEVPDGVGVLTAGIDTNDYFLTVEVVGWGRDEESWSIDHHVIPGQMSDEAIAAQLDAYLKRPFLRADGREFTIEAACHDSGGHHTNAVYDFSKKRLGRHIWAIKGASEKNGQRQPVWPTKIPVSSKKAAFRPIILGVNSAKDTVRNRLALAPPEPGQPAPTGLMHFPVGRDLEYFEQLLAERIEAVRVSGQLVLKWTPLKNRANEALDCRVYAYAALCGLKHMGLQLNRRVERTQAPPDVPSPLPATAATDALRAPKPKSPSTRPVRTGAAARLASLNRNQE